MKLNLALIPGLFITALAPPFMLGVAKYAKGDWQGHLLNGKADEFIESRTSSMLSHMTKYQNGEIYDEEGPHHLAAVAWNALCVLWYLFHHLGHELFDHDRFTQTLAMYAKQPKVTSLTMFPGKPSA